MQGDGSFCAVQSQVSGQGHVEGRLATKSLIRPRAPLCPGQGSVSVSIGGSVPSWVCLSPQAPQGDRTLQSDVGHTGDEVPQGGRPVVRRRPGIQLGKVRVQAKVPLQRQHSLGTILLRRQRIVAQTTVFGALQHACRR